MEKKKLLKYLLISFGITWILWISDAILIKLTDFKTNDLFPMILFTLGGFGPTISAIFCMEEKITLKNILSFIFKGNSRSIPILVMFLILEILIFGLSSCELNPQINISFLPIIIIQAVILYGGNEELGWRGIMQKEMQKIISYPIATLIVGTIWSIWHLPLWFIEGNSHQGSSFIIFAIFAILLSYWLAAIINTKGSVFLCMIMHGIINTLLSFFVIKVNWILIAGLILLTTISVLIGTKNKNRIVPKQL